MSALQEKKAQESAAAESDSEQVVLRLHKPYIGANQENVPEVIQLTDDLFAEDDAEQEEIRRLIKRKKKKIPDHVTTKIVERKDLFDVKSWHSQMQDLALMGKRRPRK